MGGMPGNIGKGPIFARLEEFSRFEGDDEKRTRFQEARSDLDDPDQDLVYLGKKYGVLEPRPDNPEDEHIRELWFKRWWPEHQPLEPVAREGLKLAFDKVLEAAQRGTPRPLDVYWMCAGRHFEMVTAVSDQQVTLLVCTPPPPFSLYGFAFDELEDIWVCKHNSAGYNPVGEELVSKGGAKVLTTRLWGGRHQRIST